jgi:hypothetical protein
LGRGEVYSDDSMAKAQQGRIISVFDTKTVMTEHKIS